MRPPWLILSPVVEWHHTAKGTAKTNSVTFKVLGELQPFVLTSQQKTVPIAILSVQGDRDFVGNKWSDTEGLTLTALSNCVGCPGHPERFANGALFFRYFSYGGFQRFAGSSVPGQPAYVGVFRIVGEIRWLSRTDPTREFLEVIVGYTYQPSISAGTDFPGHLDLLTLSVATFLDSGSHFGLGFSYQQGEDAPTSFAFARKSSIGLRVKF
jgi:hypothetical protein